MNPSDHIRDIVFPSSPIDLGYPRISRPKSKSDDIDCDLIKYSVEKLNLNKKTFVGVSLYFESYPEVDWTLHKNEDPKNDLAITIKYTKNPVNITKSNANDLICEFILRSKDI
jgi:hypothetical protein